jgi:integrase
VRRLKRQWYAVPRRERLVTAEQLPAFYRAVMALENPIARDYILLMLFSGLRRREAATLQWEHIDLVERVIRLPAAATKAGRKLDLPMSDYIRDMLIARRALGNAGFVFPGRGASRHTIKPFRAIAKASGIAVSAHDLRRTFATIAENTEGISPYALKAMINHALGNNDVTGDYIFISTPVLREAVQKVCDRMKRLCGVASIDGQNVAKFG